MADRKKLFINASTVLFSGGLILSQSIIETLIRDDSFEIIITCPRDGPYHQFISKHSVIKVVPKAFLNSYLRWILDYFWLPSCIRKENPDLVLTLANLPARTSFKQIFLHDNPYLIEKNTKYVPLSFAGKMKHMLRCRITLWRMRYVSLIIAQTEYQKQGLNLLLLANKIPVKVLTPSIPAIQNPKAEFSFFKNLSSKKIKILCLSRYYEHKNIESLLRLAKLIKKENLPILIYLTITKNHGKKAQLVINKISAEKLDEIIINLGYCHHNHVAGLINQVDAIILPTLLESFSLSCIEAWYYRKPLFISNLTSIQSSCGKAAFYFNPFSPSDMLRCLNRAFKNFGTIDAMIIEGDKRLKELSKWSDYTRLIKNF